MSLEGGLEKLRDKPSSTFDRQLQDWGVRMPDIPIDEFLHKNEEACGLKQDSDLYKLGDKNLRDYCFEVVQARKKDNNHQDNGNNGQKEIDLKEKKLYEALKNYTTKKISEFKNKEEHKEKLGITTEDLIKEKEEILSFVRAREALKDKKVIDYGKAAKEQEIRDAKGALRLTKKSQDPFSS